MSVLTRRFGIDRRLVRSAAVAAKMVGIGFLAGVLLLLSQFLIGAWLRATR